MGNTNFKKNILGIGAGYVGGPTLAVIAQKCPEYRVTVVDINEEKIKAWQSDDLPVFEPGLMEVVKEARDRNLFFSTEIEQNIKEADIIFVTVNTPIKTYGDGAGKCPDLQYWEKTARDIVNASESGKIVVEKSTLPVRTAESMERILNSSSKSITFDIISNPEFLAEGEAVENLHNPDRVLIGSRETESGRAAREQIAEIYAHWVDEKKIIRSNVWSAELSKLAANAFLAQRISSINSISALCEATDADIEEVAFAIGTDTRIGNRFLKSGVGFGGSCFKKDILSLVYICETYGLSEVARYWESVVEINQYQKKRFVNGMRKALFNSVANKRIALLGFAFKANTSDTREAPAFYIARHLIEEQAHVVISDPKAVENAKRDLAGHPGNIEFTEDPYAAAEEAHALAFLTEWDEYRELDFEKLYSRMEKPAFIFDGRNILDHQKLYEIGFNVYPIGKSPLSHL